jgi:carbon monoxide dehydrogenase subunit G
VPEVQYSTDIQLALEVIWEFVKDMGNWAPFLTGYQKHEVLDATDSVWTVKGDVGILSRTVQLRVHVTEWSGPERVTFTLEGLNEEVSGDGALLMAVADAAPPPAPPKLGIFRRLLNGLFRMLYRIGHRKVRREAPALPGKAATRITFILRMNASGPAGPLVNAMLAPALTPAAEDFANKLAAHLEKAHGLAGQQGAGKEALCRTA